MADTLNSLRARIKAMTAVLELLTTRIEAIYTNPVRCPHCTKEFKLGDQP